MLGGGATIAIVMAVHNLFLKRVMDNDLVVAFTNEKNVYSKTIVSKDQRKEKQGQEKTRRDNEKNIQALDAEEEKKRGNAVVSTMVLLDYGYGKNERDI